MADRVAQFWQDVRHAATEGKKAAIRAGVDVLYKATVQELASGSPGRGKRYKRGRKFHRASRRGDAPARDDGDLQRAISFEMDEQRGVVGVRNTAPYAKYLDPPKGKKEPEIGRRPFLSSAFRKNERAIQEAMADELERHLRRVGQ